MLYDDMLKLWGEPEQELTVTWPLNVDYGAQKNNTFGEMRLVILINQYQ